MDDDKKVTLVCSPDGACKPAPRLPVVPIPPHPACVITITYPQGAPDQPLIAMNEHACDDPEVALAILVAALLRAHRTD